MRRNFERNKLQPSQNVCFQSRWRRFCHDPFVSAAFANHYICGRPYTRKYYEILEKRNKLPVHQFLDDLMEKVSPSLSFLMFANSFWNCYRVVDTLLILLCCTMCIHLLTWVCAMCGPTDCTNADVVPGFWLAVKKDTTI